jgi:hypothetical protein
LIDVIVPERISCFPAKNYENKRGRLQADGSWARRQLDWLYPYQMEAVKASADERKKGVMDTRRAVENCSGKHQGTSPAPAVEIFCFIDMRRGCVRQV